MLSAVNDDGTTANGSSSIDEIVREGARRMLAAALEAEVNAYIAELADQRDETGRRLVVRNGYHQPRRVTTAAWVVEVKAPRVNDKRVDEATGERKRFSSAILPPWCRKSPKISEVLPLLYLHGLSSGDFVPALEQFLGSSAGVSPATVTRLTQQWQGDHAPGARPDRSAPGARRPAPSATRSATILREPAQTASRWPAPARTRRAPAPPGRRTYGEPGPGGAYPRPRGTRHASTRSRPPRRVGGPDPRRAG